MKVEQRIRQISEEYLQRALTEGDGTSAAELQKAEKRLGISFPLALKVYYRLTGNCIDLNSDYNQLLAPAALRIEEGYLLFMEENQEVVTWGIPVEALDTENPTVWARNNTPPETWYSEERSFTDFFAAMFYWYRHGTLPEGDK